MLAQLNDCIGGLLHLGPNVITFRDLLHLGPNVITFRTLLHLAQLLHLGLQQTALSPIRAFDFINNTRLWKNKTFGPEKVQKVVFCFKKVTCCRF